MKCKKCECDQFLNLLLVIQCTKCGEIDLSPTDDASGLDFLIERYSGDSSINKPGNDIEFIPELIKLGSREQ